LASYVGLQDGSYRREVEEREAAALQAQALAMPMQTKRLRKQNQQAAANRYRQ